MAGKTEQVQQVNFVILHIWQAIRNEQLCPIIWRLLSKTMPIGSQLWNQFEAERIIASNSFKNANFERCTSQRTWLAAGHWLENF